MTQETAKRILGRLHDMQTKSYGKITMIIISHSDPGQAKESYLNVKVYPFGDHNDPICFYFSSIISDEDASKMCDNLYQALSNLAAL